MPRTPTIERFISKLRTSLDTQTFVKLTLSQSRAGEDDVRNLYARIVTLRSGRKLSLLFRYRTRDETKNVEIADGLEQVRASLGSIFERAHLFTIRGDWHLSCQRRGGATLQRSRPVFTTVPSEKHDHEKRRVIPRDAPFLQHLAITNSVGEPRVGMADKLRQIERFVEILGHLVDRSNLRHASELHLVDLGSGKGYLTFAAYEFFRQRGVSTVVTGVEIRGDLVDKTEAIARKLDCHGLHFVRGSIADFPVPGRIEILIALHACDTATDDALHLGIRGNAQLMLAAPCCHKELRPQLNAPVVLREVLRHGVLAEREAEMITDAIRALLVEIHGYEAHVFEFVSAEHTARNLIISALAREHPTDKKTLRVRLRELLDFFGIRKQRLAHLLGEL
jgi:SAM-dependent methyltransferase